jgi:hypothetical protein
MMHLRNNRLPIVAFHKLKRSKAATEPSKIRILTIGWAVLGIDFAIRLVTEA